MKKIIAISVAVGLGVLFFLRATEEKADAQLNNPGVRSDGTVTLNHYAVFVDRFTIKDGGAAIVPGGSNGNVQYNNAGAFGGLTDIQLTARCIVASATLSGCLPAWPNDATKFFNGAGAYIAVPFTSLTGSLACGQMVALTGDITSAGGVCTTVLATVNANVGSFGSATACSIFTVNAKGLITAASSSTCTPAFGSITGVATQTFLGRTTAGTGVAEDLSATQATAILNAMVGDSGSGGTKGLVPAPATGDATKVLSGAGTYISAGTGTVTSAVIAAGTGIAVSGTCTITTTGTCTVAANPVAAVPTRATSGTDATYNVPANTFQLEVWLWAGGSGGQGNSSSTAGGQSCVALSGTACSSPVLQVSGGGTTGGGGAGTGGSTACNIDTSAGGEGGGGTGAGSVAATLAAGGGNGGTGFRGGAGMGAYQSGGGSAVANSGAGGGGGGVASTTATIGGKGGGAGGWCRHIFSTPASSYVYTIGAGGAGASAGGDFLAGGTGGAGGAIFIPHPY